MRKPIRLLHLVYSLHSGGMENGVVNLCNRLNPEEFEAAICVFEDGGALEEKVDSTRVQVHRVKRHFGNDPTVPLRLMRLLRRERYQVLHTHNWVTICEGYFAARAARVPRVVHGEHGYPFETRPRNIGVQRYLWRRIDRVTAVASPLADDLARTLNYPREHVSVIANGVDTEKFCPGPPCRDSIRADFGLPSQGILVGTVARLDPVKNHVGLIQAASLLRARGTDLHLVFAGDGPERRALMRLATELGVDDRLHMLGNVTEVERLLNAFDAFVLNSNAEGMSNTLLEAMASGLPIIATRVGSNADLIVDGESGVLINPGADEELACALERFVSQPSSAQRLAEEARNRAEQLFGLQQMVAQYQTLYREVCGWGRKTGQTRRPASPVSG